MGSSQQFSLRWNNYLSHITEAFDNLRSDEDLVDVTLSCEGKRIRAHKMLLSACSTYFRDLFKENPCQHPVIIFRNVKFEDLVALIDFMYQGEVNVVQEQLSSFLTTAELLAVQGLSEGSGKDSNPDSRELELPDSPTLPPEPEVQMSNSSQNISQQLPGTSNSDVASPSFYPSEKRSESPPTAKRRKWSSSTSGTKPSGNGNGKKDERESETERRRGSNQASSSSNVDPVEIIPEVVPNVKEEMLEYMEQDQDASSCSYSDSNQGAISGNSVQNSGRDNIPTLTQGLSSGLIHTETKQEPPDMYSSNSRESSLPPTAEGLTAADLSQILSKPGPSSENQSQDSLQGLVQRSDRPPARRGREPEAGGKRKFVCMLCGAAYSHSKSLSSHLRYHTGETECHLCHKVLSRRTHVTRHLLVKHGIFTPSSRGKK